MKHLVHPRQLSFLLFVFTLGLAGCSPSSDESTAKDAQNSADNAENSEIKSGNMLYIVRDVAELKSNTSSYFDKIKQDQENLQQALQDNNPTVVAKNITALKQQFTKMNQDLANLELKSKEVHQVRQQMISANNQLLKSSIFNGEMDLSEENLDQLQQQINSLQNNILELGALLIPKNKSSDS